MGSIGSGPGPGAVTGSAATLACVDTQVRMERGELIDKVLLGCGPVPNPRWAAHPSKGQN